MVYSTIIWKSSKIIVHDIEEKVISFKWTWTVCFSVKIVTNAECLFLGKKELKEDNNDAKKETEWRLILHKDSSSFYLKFFVFKWTFVVLCIDIFNLFKIQEVVLACFFKQGWIESVRQKNLQFNR